MTKNASYSLKPLLIGVAIVGAFLLGLIVAPKSVPPATEGPNIAEINRQSRMIIGEESAPVKIIEYADPLCPYCTKFAVESEQKLRQNYVDTGKVEFEYRAVAMIAPSSQRAVESLHCAADQDKFWQYLDYAQKRINDDYYSQGKTGADVKLFDADKIGELAELVGMDKDLFVSCVNDEKHKGQVVLDTSRATTAGVQGTPTFFIGGERYAASPEYGVMEAVIKTKL